MKVAIVNDMLMAVETLRRVLSLDKEIEIAWIANSGVQAVEKCRVEKPDLILMDLIMPQMDGVEATRIIMKETPCPIFIVTASVESNTDKVFRAMGAGALDAMNTPVLGVDAGADHDAQNNNVLLDKINKISFLFNADKEDSKVTESFNNAIGNKKKISHDDVTLIVIGASSGGPRALKKILAALPNNFSVPIIIVQHVDESFTPELVTWLSSVTNLKIKLAEKYETIKKGNVYIAAKNDHLVIDYNGVMCYSDEPSDVGYKPSVNVFFDSVSKNWRGKTIGILLTGMGVDGAQGLLQLRKRGDFTIAQDEQSSAVFGMPKEAININAAMDVMPLNKIASKIKYLTL